MHLGYIKATAKTLFRILTIREGLEIKVRVNIEQYGIPKGAVVLHEQLHTKLRQLFKAETITDKEYEQAKKLLGLK